jgi:putative transposase
MHPYPKHLASFDYLGSHRYFLTLCTFDRQPRFRDSAAVTLVESHFLRTARDCGFSDLAHCFMPDHLHAAVQGIAENADLKVFLARMKQYSGFYYKKTFGGRLWQRYSYERVIRSEQTTRDVIRYVIENPGTGLTHAKRWRLPVRWIKRIHTRTID